MFEDRSARALRAESPTELQELVRDLPKPKPAPAVVARPMAAPLPPPIPAPLAPGTAPARLAVAPPEMAGLPVPHRRSKHVSIFSSVVRQGDWRPARRSKAFAAFGETKLDFTETVLPEGATEVHCRAIFGSVRILVPEGLYVEADGSAFMGAFKETGRSTATPEPGGPWLRVTGFAIFGEIEVKVIKPKGPSLLSRAIAALTGPPRQLPPPEDP